MKMFQPLLPIRFSISKNLNFTITNFDDEGRLLIYEPYLARLVSYQIQKTYSKNVLPGKLNSLAILDGLFDFVINKFDIELTSNALRSAVKFLKDNLPEEDIVELMNVYLNNFPLREFFGKEIIENLLEYFDNNNLNEAFCRNLILIYISNQNKATEELKFVYDDVELISKSKYLQSIKILEQFFDKIRIEPLKNKSLIEFLFEPIIISPNDIEGQLNFIKDNWKEILTEDLINQILKAIDLIKEDAKIFQTAFGIGESKVPTFSLEELLGFGDKFKGIFYPVTLLEEEKFTPDTDWMPKVVLLAKNVFVWLYQLSKKYNSEIKKLNQIPDEELDMIASFGFNALWLIGIWERSPASRRIKQLSGNPEALASAYSIYDYVIAHELGGEEAYQNLNERCLRRGIRLACDIVPNHMGIFSKWLIENPDYFIQTDYPPFPSYSFSGPDLSEHPDFQIRIEDKYWTRQDAAVVFQLIENRTGKVRYIYHGNDGTNMPWNDTAQLNLLRPEVREALIQLIFTIARKFSIIRLDAAMTLTQKHYQRLWYPVPGTGGSIPSRTDFSMSTDEFLKHYPKEFWREVVDRINIEKPDTLLLAEAFWLMEGYFVRTLGMHRVYNSAFMNMLKKEENAKYRDLISNTLEFNPEILKRYVNFLSNPDEETAINQFGDGDKYFGCCVLMVTMPGLPMFAHGQIEGLKEKYGHEYVKAYYDEHPNEYFIERHKREIFPLMKRRHLFSQVQNFELFDFKNQFSEVIEDVFAYSNRINNEAALVFYNNSYSTYFGYIDFSHPKNYGTSESEDAKKLISKSLGESLGIKNSHNFFYLFRETRTNLEYLRRGSEFYNEKFFVELKGYEYKVFIDFSELYDSTGELGEFYNVIGRNGYRSINEELIKFNFSKILGDVKGSLSYDSISELIDESNLTSIQNLRNTIQSLSDKLKIERTVFEFELLLSIRALQSFNKTLKRLIKRKNNPKWLREFFERKVNDELFKKDNYGFFISVFLNYLNFYSQLDQNSKEIFIEELSKLLLKDIDLQNLNLILIISKIIQLTNDYGIEKLDIEEIVIKNLLFELMSDPSIQHFIEVNHYEGEIYYKKEKFEDLVRIVNFFTLWILTKKKVSSDKVKNLTLIEIQRVIKKINNIMIQFYKLSTQSHYKLNEVLQKFYVLKKA